jgi:uncharacterized protein YndB with AHSA1/START domain
MPLRKRPVTQTGMLIRRPVGEVFAALVDPAITSRFWFTDSTGPLVPEAQVRWTWEMYGVSTTVRVHELVPDRRIVFAWGEPSAASTVTIEFDARDGDTFVSVREAGFAGDTDDDVVSAALASMGGFSLVLAALKAYLEHGIVLAVVADRFSDGRPG